MVSLRHIVTAALAVATPLVSGLPTVPTVPTAELALSAGQIVDSIKQLTTKSQALQAPAQSITIVNGPLIIVGLGPFPQVIAGFSDIVSTGTVFISQLEGTSSIGDEEEAKNVANAFREFVRIHQQLLNILIGKAGLFNTVPFVGQPVAAVLRQVENTVDTIAFTLIDLINPGGQKQQVQNNAGSLGSSIKIAIDAYDGLSVNRGAKQP